MPPGYARAYGRLMAVYDGGYGLRPVAGASVRVFAPGTSTPLDTPLYGDAAATAPLVFPARTDPAGSLELWSEAGVRLDAEVAAPWAPDAPVRQTLDVVVVAPRDETTLLYRFSTNTAMADPGAGAFRANAAAPGTATEVAFDAMTDGGSDASNILRLLRTGDALALQDQDESAKWSRWTVTGSATDAGGWFRVPVAFVAGAGTGQANNARTLIKFTLK